MENNTRIEGENIMTANDGNDSPCNELEDSVWSYEPLFEVTIKELNQSDRLLRLLKETQEVSLHLDWPAPEEEPTIMIAVPDDIFHEESLHHLYRVIDIFSGIRTTDDLITDLLENRLRENDK